MRCAHRAGWARRGGEERCHGCGVRRFASYGAVRPPGLAVAVLSRNFLAGRQADRAAALNLTRRARYAGV
ncbi:DUF6255 family natural product biosynthesis protein [Streptomyces sp. NPDC037389]|uniref:DUF6255 family natural product biosynthesis protein n=1 Tax=Streptomyces sp. NPDC037389 TaxID=3155369 RepID=UPI0033D35055